MTVEAPVLEEKRQGSAAAELGVVLVSGGSRGLGRALVSVLLDGGATVATFSRSATPFIEQQRERDPDEERFTWRSLDALDTGAIKGFVRDLARRYGRLDALVNNAAVGAEGVLPLMRSTDIQRTISLNLEAAVHLIQACSRVMLQQGAGSIVNVSSVNGLRGHAGVSVYSATKAALDGLTRSLARELGPRGIRVNSVAPGYFAEGMADGLEEGQVARIVRRTPLGRLGRLDDVVAAVRFLLSPDAAFVTGHTLVVDGGLTC